MAQPTSKRLPAPRYAGLRPASERASAAAKGASKKRDTRCELLVRRALWRLGFRYRIAVRGLPGCPDIVLHRHGVVVFVDGDFWHGRSLEERIRRLSKGHNAPYWVQKITANVERDRRHDSSLQAAGWRVVRVWETDVRRDVESAVGLVIKVIRDAGRH